MWQGEDREDKPPPPPLPSSSSINELDAGAVVASPLLAMEVISPEELSKATQMFQVCKFDSVTISPIYHLH